MEIRDLIAADRVKADLRASSKKRALELMSQLLDTGSEESITTDIFGCLLSREKLGSTGLGLGVALPHGRVAGLIRARGAFSRLSAPIDFDAIDGTPVDLIFALLVPQESTDEHLELLAKLAQMFSNEDFCRSLRAANSDAELTNLISTWVPPANS